MKTTERWLTASDGWRLSVLELMPEAPRGVVVVGHAMMVDRRTVYHPQRASLSSTLAEQGLRVLVPDLRGHGASGPQVVHGGAWSYQRLVDDVPLYLSLARETELPVALVGNSLFGHVALAYLGTHGEGVDAMVGFAVNIWNKRWSASPPRWWLKRGLARLSALAAGATGRFPARSLGLGSNDEPLAYWRDFVDWVGSDTWAGDGDYAAALHRVTCPFLHVLSDGDRLLSQPDDALAFSSALPNRQVLRLGESCNVPQLRGLRPGHVEMVASPTCAALWQHVGGWLLTNLDGARP